MVLLYQIFKHHLGASNRVGTGRNWVSTGCWNTPKRKQYISSRFIYAGAEKALLISYAVCHRSNKINQRRLCHIQCDIFSFLVLITLDYCALKFT
jgi:hypothetical protein